MIAALSLGAAGATARADLPGPSHGTDCGSANSNTPQIAIDPGDPQHVLLAYLTGEGDEAFVATSHDGGTSWASTQVPVPTACTGAAPAQLVDPFIALGTGGNAMVMESWNTWSGGPGLDHDDNRVYALASDSTGAAFSTPTDVETHYAAQRAPVSFAPGSGTDVLTVYEKYHFVNAGPCLTDVHGPTGVPCANVWAPAYGVDGSIVAVRSFDGGQTFGAPITVYASTGSSIATAGLIRSGLATIFIGEVITEGDLAATTVGLTFTPARLFAVRSLDGGATWEAPIDMGMAGCCLPDVAAGPDGSVYAVWVDGVSNAVHVLRSDDGALTWNESIITTASTALQAAVAVNPAHEIGVFWYESTFVGDEPPLLPQRHMLLQPIFASSSDGTSWSRHELAPAFRLDMITGGSADGLAVGPYQDIAGAPGGFLVAATIGDGDAEHVAIFRASNGLTNRRNGPNRRGPRVD